MYITPISVQKIVVSFWLVSVTAEVGRETPKRSRPAPPCAFPVRTGRASEVCPPAGINRRDAREGKGRTKMSKQVQKVCNVISTVVVVLAVILALLLVGVRLVGLRPMCVLSGSMEPTYHTGSLIYVKPCAPEDVQVGDAITFVLNEDLDVVTHRVISIDAENEHFYTQGDANDAPDGAPVYFKNLIGRPVFTIPYLGYVSHWVSNPPGMYLAIAIAIVLVVLAFLPDMLRKAAEADARDAARRAEAANTAKCTETDDKNRKI